MLFINDSLLRSQDIKPFVQYQLAYPPSGTGQIINN